MVPPTRRGMAGMAAARCGAAVAYAQRVERAVAGAHARALPASTQSRQPSRPRQALAGPDLACGRGAGPRRARSAAAPARWARPGRAGATRFFARTQPRLPRRYFVPAQGAHRLFSTFALSGPGLPEHARGGTGHRTTPATTQRQCRAGCGVAAPGVDRFHEPPALALPLHSETRIRTCTGIPEPAPGLRRAARERMERGALCRPGGWAHGLAPGGRLRRHAARNRLDQLSHASDVGFRGGVSVVAALAARGPVAGAAIH